MTRLRLTVLLGLVVLAGGALRVDAALDPDRRQSADERAYTGLAHGVARDLRYAHTGMADPAHWPPGAPMLFAAAMVVAPGQPGGPRDDAPAGYAAQAIVATALIAVVGWLALLVGGAAAGLGAATVVAFYPPLARGPQDLLSEPLGALLLAAAALALVGVTRRREHLGLALLTGALLGLTVLTRADLLLVPLLAVAVLWIAAGRRSALLAAGACALTVAPWVAFASSISGAPVPVSSGGASNLFVGTYLPGGGTMFGAKRELADDLRRMVPAARAIPVSQLPQDRILDAVAARRPELGRDAALRREALDNLDTYAFGRPFAFAGMAAEKIGRLWGRPTAGTDRTVSVPERLGHLALLAAIAVGLVLGLRRRAGPLVVLAASLAVYVSLLNAVLVSEARHALTVLPVLVAAAAAGIALHLRRGSA